MFSRTLELQLHQKEDSSMSVYDGDKSKAAPDQVKAGGAESFGIEGQMNAVTSEEQTLDQQNANQGRPIASVQQRELQ
jgi:hypothetical protein